MRRGPPRDLTKKIRTGRSAAANLSRLWPAVTCAAANPRRGGVVVIAGGSEAARALAVAGRPGFRRSAAADISCAGRCAGMLG